MEIKGEEFLKKVKIRQEKDELEEKLSELRQQEENIYSEQQEVIKEEIPSNNENSTPEFDLNISQNAQNAYENIALDEIPTPEANSNKTKKYLIYGAALISIFLVTIVIFKVIMGDEEKKDDTFTSSNNIETKKDISTVDSNFQKIMNEKKKREEELKQATLQENRMEAAKLIDNNPMSDAAMNKTISKIQEKEQEQLSETQKIIRDIEEKQIQSKPVIVQETKKEVKKEVSTPDRKLVQDIESTAPKGYFIQVGAFTKTPSQNYINNIKKANLKYKIYQVNVKDVMYNKVLIGPYSSRAQAKQDVENIKKKLNLSSAFVLKF